MFVPSSVLAYLAARFWHRGGEAARRRRIERALAPIAVGLTIASSLALIRGTEHRWTTYVASHLRLAGGRCDDRAVIWKLIRRAGV
jgi:hypothetical protein